VFDYSIIPEHMRGGARRYIEDGIEPGSFMRAVLENDFVGAINKADRINEFNLKEWAQFVYWEVPSDAWKSREAVDRWIKSGGLKGQAKKKEDPPDDPICPFCGNPATLQEDEETGFCARCGETFVPE